MTVTCTSEGYGDAGDDVLILAGNALAYGGAGDDRFVTRSLSLSGTATTATGGTGADLHLVSSATYGDLDPAATTTITDFDPAEDAVGVVVFPEQRADITVNSRYDAAADVTVVTVRQAFATAPLSQTVAVFRLQGQQGFDAANLRFVEPPGY